MIVIEHQVKIVVVVLHIAIGGSLKHYNDYDPLDMLSFYDSPEEYIDRRFPYTPIRPDYDATEKFFQRRYVDEIVHPYNGVHPYFKKNMLAFMSAIFKLGDVMENSGRGENDKDIKDYLDEGLQQPEATGAALMKRFGELMKFFKTMGRVYKACEMRRQSIEFCDRNSTDILKGWGMETVPLILEMSGSFSNEYFTMESELVEAANADRLNKYLKRHDVDIAGLAAIASQLTVAMREKPLKLSEQKQLSLKKKVKALKHEKKSAELKGEKKRQRGKYVMNPYSTFNLY